MNPSREEGTEKEKKEEHAISPFVTAADLHHTAYILFFPDQIRTV
ncbi:hypothetical protein L195_g062412 [Trifolium pratense]|uniref:Uncharacterized protein n=1 Tax=Trifolium pratense TaxID=57577 RepID=A0A2K3KFI7_TRIPR|nr:hypothetical protein L195_g062412 [Trifolium pratense]